MAAATAYFAAVTGTKGEIIRVGAVTQPGPALFELTGLAETAVRPARDRIRAAVINSGLPWPGERITVTLDPPLPPRRGGAFDLAIAVAILTAAGSLPAARLRGAAFTGELGLDGAAPGARRAARGHRRRGCGPDHRDGAARQPGRGPARTGMRVLTAPDLGDAVQLLASDYDLAEPLPAPGPAALAGSGPPMPVPVPALPGGLPWGVRAARSARPAGTACSCPGRPARPLPGSRPWSLR